MDHTRPILFGLFYNYLK